MKKLLIIGLSNNQRLLLLAFCALVIGLQSAVVDHKAEASSCKTFVFSSIRGSDKTPQIYSACNGWSRGLVQSYRLTNNVGSNFYPVQSHQAGIMNNSDEAIAYHSDQNGNWEIYMILFGGLGDTRTELNLTRNPADDMHPTWSPDGKSVAFASNRSGNWDIWVMASDGTNPRNITNNQADDNYPSWSRDIDGDSYILFQSNRSGIYQIWMMRPNGSRLRQVTFNNVDTKNPTWCNRSTILVELSVSRVGQQYPDTYQLDLESGESILWRRNAGNATCGLGYFESNASGVVTIWLRGRDGEAKMLESGGRWDAQPSSELIWR